MSSSQPLTQTLALFIHLYSSHKPKGNHRFKDAPLSLPLPRQTFMVQILKEVSCDLKKMALPYILLTLLMKQYEQRNHAFWIKCPTLSKYFVMRAIKTKASVNESL